MNKIICLLLLFLSPLVFSQELNCTIDINFQQITGADPSVYEKMKKDIFDFMNNRKWTNDVYAPVEKIECNFFITISKVADDNASFSASLQVQSSRPVYGTNLKAAMLSIQDDNFNFTYSLNQALDYTDNEALSNLTSVLAYYVYIILAYDYDSFSLKGGSDYLQRAQNVLNNNSGQAGWNSNDGNQGRYWLIENFNYHRLGMDVMSADPVKGRQVIFDALKTLEAVNKRKPNSYSMKVFFDTKNRELVSLFSDESVTEKQPLVDYLSKLDPGNAMRYSKILEKK